MLAAWDWTITFVLKWLASKTNQRRWSRNGSTRGLRAPLPSAPLHKRRTCHTVFYGQSHSTVLTCRDYSTRVQQQRVKREAKPKCWYLALRARGRRPRGWQSSSGMNYFLSSMTDRWDLNSRHTSGRAAKAPRAFDRDKCDSHAARTIN